MPVMPTIPEIVMPIRVLDEIVRESLAHPDTETGQSLVGIEKPNQIVIVGVIPQLVGGIREGSRFQAGGDHQVQIFRWYNEHWNWMRDISREQRAQSSRALVSIPPEFDYPLAYIGDWHKHPGSFRQLSGQDLHELRTILFDPHFQRSQFLAPIFTIAEIGHTEFAQASHGITGQVGYTFNLDVHYVSPTRRDVSVVKVEPTVIDDKYVPTLPKLPWHITAFGRLDQELGLLQNAGYQVHWALKRRTGDTTMQIAFGIDHPKWTCQLVVYTPWNYPDRQVTYDIYPKPEDQPAEVIHPTQPASQPTDSGRRTSFLGGIMKVVFGDNRAYETPIPYQTKRPTYRPMVARQGRYLIDLVHDLEHQNLLPFRVVAPVVVQPPAKAEIETGAEVAHDSFDEEPSVIRIESNQPETPEEAPDYGPVEPTGQPQSYVEPGYDPNWYPSG